MTLIPRHQVKASKVVIDLNGPSGNAWVLLGTAKGACKQLGIDPEPILDDMRSGNYKHLVETFDKHFGKLFDLVLPDNWDAYE